MAMATISECMHDIFLCYEEQQIAIAANFGNSEK